MKNTALLVIDVQNEIINNSEAQLYNSEQFLMNIRNLIEKARKAIIPIIFIQHTEADHEPMGKGKFGWEIYSDFTPNENDYVILKYTPDAFHQTTLNDLLLSLDINQLIICGLQTEFCIDTTCRRSFSLGYKTVLIEDAHSTYNDDLLTAEQIIWNHNRIIGNWFARLVNTKEIDF